MNEAVDLCAFADEWAIETERAGDAPAREALLDRVMGNGRFLKSSEMLRTGRSPSSMLALVARQRGGRVMGTVRLWDVMAGGIPSLLLGPLAVDGAMSGKGLGTALMQEAVSRAHRFGHGSILLVGDPAYYARFGFNSGLASTLSMPGDFDRKRLLALELQSGHLRSASGMITVGQHHEALVA